MPDFIDFDAQMAATGDDERKLLEAAMSRAEAASDKARFGLRKAGKDAEGHYDVHGRRVGETSLSESASYSDYLSAKGEAEKAWAAAATQDVNPRSMRNVLSGNMGVGARGEATGKAFGQQEQQLGGELEGLHRDLETGRARDAADAEAKKAADAAEKKATQEAKQRYLEALLGGSKGRAAAGGTQRDYVGGYNPYASSAWAQQQGAQEAAQARSMGASEEQVRGIWNNYTQKGEFGSSQQPGGRDDYMNNAMEPWMKKEEG